MKKILPVLLISLVYFCGCKKDKTTPPPALTKGSISGMISPAGPIVLYLGGYNFSMQLNNIT